MSRDDQIAAVCDMAADVLDKVKAFFCAPRGSSEERAARTDLRNVLTHAAQSIARMEDEE